MVKERKREREEAESEQETVAGECGIGGTKKVQHTINARVLLETHAPYNVRCILHMTQYNLQHSFTQTHTQTKFPQVKYDILHIIFNLNGDVVCDVPE